MWQPEVARTARDDLWLYAHRISECQIQVFPACPLLTAPHFLHATFDRSVVAAPDRDGPTGRIKFGTESNGGFKNISISNCVFDRSRGLALEIVDGGSLEDVTITNLTMRDIVNSPIFLRLGNRARGPEGTGVGVIRRVKISNIVVYDADARYASQIVGLPDHVIEDVSLSNIRILYKGGLTMEQVAGYPEPSMFGLLPAYGLYVRHAERIKVHNVELGFMEKDTRPAVVLDDVTDIEFVDFEAQTAPGSSTFVLRNVRDFSTHRVKGLADVNRATVETESF